ncbi:MAG: PH domain-containing protein [Verrucomicrobiota bacterium]|nr:PH domain-containing protein [Verrucomicrobiota bacterium]
MEFLIHRHGRNLGPYSEPEVRSRLISGALTLADLAWHEGTPDWKPLSSFPQFVTSSPPQQPPVPTVEPARPVEPLKPSSATPPSSSFGSYTRITLQPNEQPRHKTTIHWMALMVPFLGALFSLILIIPIALFASWKDYHFVWLLLVIPLLIVASAYLTLKTSELVITDRRVLIKVGFLQRRTFEVFISQVESVAVTQSVIGKMLNYGTVEIRGTGGSAESFPTIVAPLRFRDAIQLAQTNHS